MSHQSEVTQLLSELGRGGPAASNRLMPILYDELRHIAQRHMRGERPGHTLDTTALVHEAYVKLVGLDRMTWQNRAHFLAVAAQAMRRVLVDYAVTRRAQKRGGSGSECRSRMWQLGRINRSRRSSRWIARCADSRSSMGG